MGDNAEAENRSAYDNLMEGVKNKVPLGELQKLYTAYVVSEMGGNKVKASAQLGIDRRTMGDRAQKTRPHTDFGV